MECLAFASLLLRAVAVQARQAAPAASCICIHGQGLIEIEDDDGPGPVPHLKGEQHAQKGATASSRQLTLLTNVCFVFVSCVPRPLAIYNVSLICIMHVLLRTNNLPFFN